MEIKGIITKDSLKELYYKVVFPNLKKKNCVCIIIIIFMILLTHTTQQKKFGYICITLTTLWVLCVNIFVCFTRKKYFSLQCD